MLPWIHGGLQGNKLTLFKGSDEVGGSVSE